LWGERKPLTCKHPCQVGNGALLFPERLALWKLSDHICIVLRQDDRSMRQMNDPGGFTGTHTPSDIENFSEQRMGTVWLKTACDRRARVKAVAFVIERACTATGKYLPLER
jgi:hypothetical protein